MLGARYANDGSLYFQYAFIPVLPPISAGFSDRSFFQRDSLFLLPAPEVFGASRRKSPHYLEGQFATDGKDYWWMLVPNGNSESPAKELSLELEIHARKPDAAGLPIQVTSIGHSTPDGGGRLNGTYLFFTSTLQQLAPTNVNGTHTFTHLVVSEPNLEDLVNRKFSTIEGRWLSGVLIEAKNKTLPRLLRESKTDKLVDLTTMIEKRILEITHSRELAKDRAQTEMQKEQKNQPQIEADRKLALLCNEVIEVLKPILAAVKEEVANRAK
jgi:hypothetical protein